MLEPHHLLDQAERLLVPLPGATVPRMADRYRAVSATYYAVFHAGLRAAADQFVGAAERASPLYSLAYRSIEHKRLNALCIEFAGPTVSNRYDPYRPAAGWDDAVRSYAKSFGTLYRQRMLADYDPSHMLVAAQAETFITIAREAIAALDGADATSKRAFFTVLLFPPR